MNAPRIVFFVFGALIIAGSALAVYGMITMEDRRDAWAAECAAQPGATPELCRFLKGYIVP